MTSQQQPISDEEFAALLARPCPEAYGPATAMTGTPVDDADVRDLRHALRSYRLETLHWAERRSAGQPSLAAPARRQARWAALPRWSLALVAVVTIAGGVAHLTDDHGAAEQVAVSALPADQPYTAADIEADNLLLSSIDAELSYHAVSPVDSLRLQDKQGESPSSFLPDVND